MNPKILIVTGGYIPGVKGGGPIRAIKNIVEALHTHFDFYIVTSDRDLGDTHPYKGVCLGEWIQGECAQIYYISERKLTFSRIREFLMERDYQAVYLNSFFSWQFSIKWSLLLNHHSFCTRVVLDPRGEFGDGAINQKWWKKYVYIFVTKLLGLYRYTHFQATTCIEKKDIQAVMGENTDILEANDIPDQLMPFCRFTNKKIGSLDVVFIARIHPQKKLLYFLDILNQIKGDISLSIYGPIEDKRYWDECQRRIETLPSSVQVEYKGILPNHQVVDVLRQHELYILPTRGENFGYSIVEALSAGTPVMISDQTPWRGLRQQCAGADIALSNKCTWIQVLQEFVNMDEKQFRQYEEGAYKYAAGLGDRNKVFMEYERLFLGDNGYCQW